MKQELWVALANGVGIAAVIGIIEKLLTPYINRTADKLAATRLDFDRQDILNRFDAEQRTELKDDRNAAVLSRREAEEDRDCAIKAKHAAEERAESEGRRADVAEETLRRVLSQRHHGCATLLPENILQVTDTE